MYPADKKNSADEKNSITSTSSSLESSQNNDDNMRKLDSNQTSNDGERNIGEGLKASLPSRRDLFSIAGLSAVYAIGRNAGSLGDILTHKDPILVDENGMIMSIPFVAPEPVMVKSWPGIEYLEPMMDLVSLVETVDKISSSKKDALIPYANKRLNDLFDGGYFSSGRSFYAGFSLQYQSKISYDLAESQDKISIDKRDRFIAMENTLNSLENVLAEFKKVNVDMDLAQIHSASATNSINAWMANIPSKQLDKAKTLYAHSLEADLNKDGHLNEREIKMLPEDEQII